MALTITENEALARYTSWRIGGPARCFVEVDTPQRLAAALAWADARGLPVFMLGGGSNVLVADAGFAGLVLRYRDQSVAVQPHDGGALVRAGAGAPTAGTARRLAQRGLAGLEWAEGVPGTIGGALYGNAGCYGGDIAGCLTRAWLLVGGHVEEWPVARLAYTYRSSALKVWRPDSAAPAAHRPIALAAEFRLAEADPLALTARMAETAQARRSKTPSGQSCGSVFKNPAGDSAGRLIEAAGLKGARAGGAQIAEKHANYIVNRGGATCADVLRLVELARTRVLGEFGVELELEVQLLGG